ncbi:hypothetical protein D3C71_1482420 [compost metagenome]
MTLRLFCILRRQLREGRRAGDVVSACIKQTYCRASILRKKESGDSSSDGMIAAVCADRRISLVPKDDYDDRPSPKPVWVAFGPRANCCGAHPALWGNRLFA